MYGESVLIDDEDDSPPPQPPPMNDSAPEPKQPETTEAAAVDAQEKATTHPMETDELMSLYNECFSSETILIFDRHIERLKNKTSKSNQCMIMNCTSDSPLEVPPKYIQAYYKFPEGKKPLICKDCITKANAAVQERCDCLETGKSVFNVPFPSDDPVVSLSSDDESEEKPDFKKFEKDTFTDDFGTFIKQLIDTADTAKQTTQANVQIEASLTYTSDTAKALTNEVKNVEKDLSKEMKNMDDSYHPTRKMLPSVILHSVPENKDLVIEEDVIDIEEDATDVKDVIVIEDDVIDIEDDGLDIKADIVNMKDEVIVIEDDDNIGRVGIRGSIERRAGKFRKKLQSTQPVHKVGDNFYVESHSDVNKPSKWVPAQIEECIGITVENGNVFKKYRVKMHRGKGTIVYKKEVDTSQMAYFQPDALKLHIGSRIIALHHSVTGQKKFHSGMIAELPSRANKYRFLIFFHHGHTQYAATEDIRKILDDKKQIHEYFGASSQEFIIQYLKCFPEIPMLRVSETELVSTEYKGSWVNTRVMEVDASLIKVVFLKDMHKEWLYRGSPRFRLMYDKQKMMKKQEIPGSKVRHRGTTVHRNRGPYIQYEMILSDESDTDDPDSGGDINHSSGPSLSRAVARKSTRRAVMQGTQMGRYLQMLPPRRTSQRRVTRQDLGRVQQRYPNGILNPKVFEQHKCTTYCVSWVGYNEDKTKGINPLAIPAICAFRRDIERSNVYYVAPCGKKLRGFEELLTFLKETKLPLTVDLFDFDPRVQIFDEFVVAPEHILIDDITRGCEHVPIPCVNSQSECIPDLIEYMTERRGIEGVTVNTDPGFLIGCDCTDNCQDKSKCLCWQQTLTQAKAFNFNVNPDDIGYRYKRLKELILTGIYECNSQCKCCTKTCLNRVVQQPLKIKLQLYKTEKKGWGTRCVNDIPIGTFICVYVWEYTYRKICKRVDDKWVGPSWLDRSLENSEYTGSSPRNTRSQKGPAAANEDPRHEDQPQSSFAVFNNSDQADEERKPSVRSYYGEDEAVYIMDSNNAGNIGRYLNHSCDPNIFVQNVFVDTHDLRFPWVSFFALKYIPAGTELTWDYGYNVDSVPGKILYCYCGASNCRRRLL